VAEPQLDRQDLIARLSAVFREHGYAGASLAAIGAATGLGKGSLYHAFPGGKAEMAEAVLAEIHAWFESQIFAPLETRPPGEAVPAMLAAARGYFEDGGRICLVGAFALSATRDRFAEAVSGYFDRWQNALAACLQRGGLTSRHAESLAAETLAAIQGSLVLARARQDSRFFTAALERQAGRLHAVLSARDGGSAGAQQG